MVYMDGSSPLTRLVPHRLTLRSNMSVENKHLESELAVGDKNVIPTDIDVNVVDNHAPLRDYDLANDPHR